MDEGVIYSDVFAFVDYGNVGDFGFYPMADLCPFCKKKLDLLEGPWNEKELIQSYNNQLAGSSEELLFIKVKQCKICEWWTTRQINVDLEWDQYSRLWSYNSVIKSINVMSPEVPINELGIYISKHSDKIYSIHHKKMEELVGDVLKEHFDCEVVHCGQSHDRGIDLLLILTDEIIPVQVKRRTKASSMESVSTVRDLLGVMLRDQRKKAILVSTAKDFTKEAKRDVTEVINKGIVDRFDLFNYQNFVNILKSRYHGREVSMLDYIPESLGGSRKRLG
jgi:restriction system protein